MRRPKSAAIGVVIISSTRGFGDDRAEEKKFLGIVLEEGFEFVLGTPAGAAESDRGGIADAVEFPMSGVAVSDPCSGSGGSSCPADVIFRHGFQ